MERLESIVQAGELKPGDVIRRDLNTQYPDERKQTVVSIELTGQDGANVVFESPEKIRWSTHYRRSQRLVLVHRPRPEGKTEERALDEIFAQTSEFPMHMFPMSEDSLDELRQNMARLRRALEDLELSQLLEPEK